MEDNKKKSNKMGSPQSNVLWGLCIGLLFGIAMDNILLGLLFGLAFGLLYKRKTNDK